MRALWTHVKSIDSFLELGYLNYIKIELDTITPDHRFIWNSLITSTESNSNSTYFRTTPFLITLALNNFLARDKSNYWFFTYSTKASISSWRKQLSLCLCSIGKPCPWTSSLNVSSSTRKTERKINELIKFGVLIKNKKFSLQGPLTERTKWIEHSKQWSFQKIKKTLM